MADEPTMYTPPPKPPAGSSNLPPKPPAGPSNHPPAPADKALSLVQVLLCTIPAAAVGILAALLVYRQLDKAGTETQQVLAQQFKDGLEKETSARAEEVKKADDTKKVLQDELKKLTEKNKELSTENSGMRTEFKSIETELGKYIKSQETVDSNQNKDINTVSKDISNVSVNVNKLETKVKYIDEKLQKLDKIEASVADLRKDTGELKEAHTRLKGDIDTVRKKGEVTDVELADLSEKARLFQLRVLQARAREAADAARQMDLRKLMDRLNDAEGK